MTEPTDAIQLHAQDPMGAAAHKAAMLLSRQDLRLLGAASPTLERGARSAELSRFFVAWPAICRAVSLLAETAPNAAAKGAEEDARAQDFIEARAVTGGSHDEPRSVSTCRNNEQTQ
jgi:hypothetical protein